MRKTTEHLEPYRIDTPDNRECRGTMFGAFLIESPATPMSKAVKLKVIAADADEMTYFSLGIHGPLWEHVSVSVLNVNRCPTWEEMNYVKGLFWEDEETVLQFHPAKSQYVNNHPFTLHLWRMKGSNHTLPDRRLI